jgi:hypothetical protein
MGASPSNDPVKLWITAFIQLRCRQAGCHASAENARLNGQILFANLLGRRNLLALSRG